MKKSTQNSNQQDPTSKNLGAAALKYDGKEAPTLVAKGYGETARQIIDLAAENNIHIHQDPMLLEVLSHLDLGQEIPRELYLAVAKIIAFAYFLQGKHPHGKQNSATEPVDHDLLSANSAPQLRLKEHPAGG